ncbi:conserved protein of unknown function [Ectopseudomonas oleovorans]|uniref:Uncharacterized protein n=1 Tax=Ectopseudomonas oleovorans TaxID=301 RepID=A0A653BBH8_ECTOL|nr:conserved protein of unknown function [Pseudomonas oleovorans]
MQPVDGHHCLPVRNARHSTGASNITAASPRPGPTILGLKRLPAQVEFLCALSKEES